MNNYEFFFDGETITTSIDKNTLSVTINDRKYELQRVGENSYASYVNGQRSVIAVVQHQGTYYIDVDSVQLELKEPSDDTIAGGAEGHAGEKDKIYAPMPGKIVKIMVEVGDEVTEKQPMVVVEAMKMENQVNAKAKGKVKAVNFSAGDQVDTETPIIELELEETG